MSLTVITISLFATLAVIVWVVMVVRGCAVPSVDIETEVPVMRRHRVPRPPLSDESRSVRTPLPPLPSAVVPLPDPPATDNVVILADWLEERERRTG